MGKKEEIIVESKVDTEEIPLILIYLKDDELCIKFNEQDDIDIYRLYGYLNLYVKQLEKKLIDEA